MDHSAALLEHNARLVDVAAGVEAERTVPTCPGWTMAKLVTHVGRGDRWAAEVVRTGGPVETRAVPDGKPGADVGAWLAASPRRLLDAVAAAPDEPVWTFLGPRPAAWWVRRRLHESTVHWADAVLAAGGHPVLDPAVAADGVSEWLDLLAARPPAADPALDPGVVLHLHATDEGLGPDGEWTITGTDDGALRWEPGHGRGAAAVRGTASDLLLAGMRRIPAEPPRLEVLGDAAVLDRWLERTAF